MKSKSLHIFLASLLCLPFTLFAQEQLAIWTFPSLSGVMSGTNLSPTTEDVVGSPVLQQLFQDIDDNGTDGVAYTDVEGVNQPANRAIEWDDIKGSGSDATLEITINTTGWEDIFLRFDYLSELAESFDLEYSTDGGVNFTKPFNNTPITAEASLTTWRSKVLDLSGESGMENAASVLIRLNDFDAGPGNDKLDLDNIELYGTKIAAPPGAPDIQEAATTLPYLSLSADGPGFVSGVVSDVTDPASLFGIDFVLTDADTPLGSLTVSATSSNMAVVPNANLILSGTDGERKLKITPIGVGYTTITVTVSDGVNMDTYTIEYAASAALPPTSVCHTGASDASTAVAIDASYMFVADDEDETIRLYDRDQAGLPLASFDFSSVLGKVDSREVDIEASLRVGNTIYWLGSHSNSADGDIRPNRSRLFATTISGSGISTNLTFVDYYPYLKDDLVAWDSGNQHGLGADHFGFAAGTAAGVIPETAGGFNIEGLALAPGSTTTAYIGFRAPVAGPALIIPVTNFTTLPGASSGSATFGTPIELDLGGLGIRSMARNASDVYLIIAGPAGASGAFQLYKWDGNPASTPIAVGTSPSIDASISFESIVEVPNPFADGGTIQMLADNGNNIWYNDGIISKDLPQVNHQKFCSGLFVVNICDVAIASVDVEDESCAGDSDGTITINASCTTCTGILYSIDGGTTTQASNTFTGLAPGTYMPYVEDSGDMTCMFSDSEVTINTGAPLPANPIAATASKEFCQNTELAASLANTGINVSNSLSANEKVVWVLTAAPAGSSYTAGDEFTTPSCGDPFADLGELAVANTSKVIRVNDPGTAPVGTYTFDAYIMNCVTGCLSGLTSGFSITIHPAPSVEITADPDGDICLNTMDVQYNAAITSEDGGTYSYMWCAYNSGDGSGTCFNGFSDNTAQDPTRSWTSSAGTKSVGVTVMSDVPGCEAEDLYSFEVVAPTMVACPVDQFGTLVTDDVTFECAAPFTWMNPEVMAGPCDPVTLTISITGGSVNISETVIPGDPFSYTFMELGTFLVTYDLVDAVGNMSTCSFMVTVDGLPCGWVDNGGIGCNGNSSDFDLATEIFSLTANNCATDYPYNSDQLAFVYTELCGDGEIIARVTNVDGTGFAGVMMRDSEDPGAPLMAIGTNSVNRVLKQVRILPGYPAFPQLVLAYDQFWVRVVRQGNQFFGFASTDGVNWIPYLNQQVFMANNCLRVGLFTYSEKPGTPITASFDNVFVTGVATPLAGLPNTGIAQKETMVATPAIGVYPNPASSMLNIEWQHFDGEQAQIMLFNSLGQPVKTLRAAAGSAGVEQLDVSGMTPGIYNLVFKMGETIRTQRVVIARD